MKLSVEFSELSRSVLSVPPLAVDAGGEYAIEQNARLIDHLHGGGVTTLLYGGNALVYHWSMARYADWLDKIVDAARQDAWVVPSVGADGGRLLEQAPIIRERRFPVVMLLPIAGPYTQEGLLSALTRFSEQSGAKLLIYIKKEDYIAPETLSALDDAGALYGVKYAVPRPKGGDDALLRDLIQRIGAERIVSGFGEPPAVHHLTEFKLAGFTAGCVCIAPAISMAVLKALRGGEAERARELMQPLMPLEALRGEINEIRVMHDAVTLSGVADMGPILAPSSPVPETRRAEVAQAARALLAAENEFRSAVSAA